MAEKVKTRSAKRMSEVMKKTVAQAVKMGELKKAVKISPDEFVRLVQEKAYELYVSRGYQHGDDMADWFEAERRVKAKLGL